jgi:hypothetical protein
MRADVAVKAKILQLARRFGGFPIAIALLAGVLVILGIGGWLAARAISNAICSSYNDISNDFCDEWNYATPPANALPVPARWEIRWEKLDCGSGGCGSRLYVLSADPISEGGVGEYLREIGAQGWRIGPDGVARKRDLQLDVRSAAEGYPSRLIPMGFMSKDFVFVSLAICGEGAICD